MASADSQVWVCGVCGYVHHGAQGPDTCPICGAPQDAFEPETAPAAAPTIPDVQSWKCLNCSFVHQGSAPPEVCPVCGAPQDCFEGQVEAAGAEAVDGGARKIVIVGAGIAGLAAAEAARTASDQAQIVLVSKEQALPYYRLNLTRYLAGEIDETVLPVKSEDWFTENRVELLRGQEVAKLLLDEQSVALCGGAVLPFDKLILTAGAHPFVPPFPGANREGVTSLRTLADARKILQEDLAGKRCVCIGGGLLGLETAGAIARQGADVTLLEGHGWLLPRQLNEKAGNILAEHVAGSGIQLRRQARTQELLGDERVRGVLLEDGEVIDADLVIVATGVRSNSYLGRMAGLDVNRGIVVDNLLQTSRENVFAAGDIAEHRGCVYGTWGPAQYQGRIAGMNAVGASTQFGGISRSNALKVLQMEMFSIGEVAEQDGSYYAVEAETGAGFVRFVFRDGHLVGAILLGDAQAAAPVKKAVDGKVDFSDLLSKRPGATDVLGHIAG